MSRNSIALVSPSRATDAAWSAASDVARVAAALDARYRLVGGIAVTFLTHVHGVDGVVPSRETADADLALRPDVCASPQLVEALENEDYTKVSGNRFERRLSGQPDRVIDIVTSSHSDSLVPNQELGSLHVDALPGLHVALAAPATMITVNALLTNGADLEMTLALPDVSAALVMKAYAYRGRFLASDALDVWRLLEAAHAAGRSVADWPSASGSSNAADHLHQFFGRLGAPGPQDATQDAAAQARIRLLVSAVVPPT